MAVYWRIANGRNNTQRKRLEGYLTRHDAMGSIENLNEALRQGVLGRGNAFDALNKEDAKGLLKGISTFNTVHPAYKIFTGKRGKLLIKNLEEKAGIQKNISDSYSTLVGSSGPYTKSRQEDSESLSDRSTYEQGVSDEWFGQVSLGTSNRNAPSFHHWENRTVSQELEQSFDHFSENGERTFYSKADGQAFFKESESQGKIVVLQGSDSESYDAAVTAALFRASELDKQNRGSGKVSIQGGTREFYLKAMNIAIKNGIGVDLRNLPDDLKRQYPDKIDTLKGINNSLADSAGKAPSRRSSQISFTQ